MIDGGFARHNIGSQRLRALNPIWKDNVMSWNKPKVKEVCIGMEINDYFPAEL